MKEHLEQLKRLALRQSRLRSTTSILEFTMLNNEIICGMHTIAGWAGMDHHLWNAGGFSSKVEIAPYGLIPFAETKRADLILRPLLTDDRSGYYEGTL